MAEGASVFKTTKIQCENAGGELLMWWCLDETYWFYTFLPLLVSLHPNRAQPHFKVIKLVRPRFLHPRVLLNSCSERTQKSHWPAAWPTQLQPLQSWTLPDHSEDVAFCGITVQRWDIPPAFNSPWTSPMRHALNTGNHSWGYGWGHIPNQVFN